MNSLGRAGRELGVQLLLDDVQPAVVALSETEVPKDDNVVFNNYKVFYPLVSPSGKFRMLLLLRDDWASKYSPQVFRTSTMGIWLRVEAPGGTIAIGAFYRQWSAREEEDLVELCDQILEISGEVGRVVIMGDLNLDLARMGDTGYYRRRLLRLLLGCIEQNELCVANFQDMSPTYFSHGTFIDGSGSASQKTSILDHIYYRGLPTPTFNVLPIAMTDHRPIIAKFGLLQQTGSLKYMIRRNFKSISTPSISMAINAEALSKVFMMNDVEEIHTTIIHEIVGALDLVSPLQQVLVKDRRTPLYLSQEARSAMNERDRAAARHCSHVEYRRLRNKAARLVRRDKLASNMDRLEEQGLDSKSIWDLANAVSGRSARCPLPAELKEGSGDNDGIVKGDAELANFINKFYIDKIDKIRAGIDKGRVDQQQQQPPQQRQQQPQHHFRFRPPTEREVLAIIMGLNNTNALGIDGIPVVVLKHLAPIIAAPTAHLVRKSFELAMVPLGFKKATIIPLHKRNKPPNLASSYRPVALLPALSKVLERVVLRQVSTHLAPLLPPTQFGFRPRRSTAAAIAYAHGSWSAAKARGLAVAVAGFDLSSAFDTVDVEMVSGKLHGFGIMGRENQWFLDYLSNRAQLVQYNDARSTFREVKYGVPQGSILGPLLFLAMVADLPSEVLSLSLAPAGAATGEIEVGFSAYADDALCWVAARDQEVLGKTLEELSAVMVSYASKNYLALNEQKTQVLWSPHKGFPIKVGSSLVPPSSTLDILGVTFDKQLSPNPYMNSLVASTKSLAAVARRLSLHLPANILKSVVGALVQGKIGYACLVLPPRFKPSDPLNTLMSQLQVGINDVARAMIGSRRSDKLKIEDLLQEANLTSVNRMTVYAIAMECWRALNLRDVSNGPLNPLGALLSPPTTAISVVPRTRSVANGCLPPPTKKHVCTFTWWAHTCWNVSPLLRSATTLSAAKRAAKELAASVPL